VCCSVLQCVAVCCSVLQCVAVCCSVLQCVAVCCSVLQCVAVIYARLIVYICLHVGNFCTRYSIQFFSYVFVHVLVHVLVYVQSCMHTHVYTRTCETSKSEVLLRICNTYTCVYMYMCSRARMKMNM